MIKKNWLVFAYLNEVSDFDFQELWTILLSFGSFRQHLSN